MWFDLDTLFFTMVFTAAVAGCLLLLTWVQNRSVSALSLWGLGFLVGAGGLALIVLRGVVADVWSIVVGNAILAAGYGIVWLGVRKFEERRLVVPVALAGAALWLAVCAIEALYANPRMRMGTMAAIVVSYSLLNVFEFWRGRSAGLMSRWPIIAVMLVHAVTFMLRIPLAGTWPLLHEEKAPLDWYIALTLEAMLVVFCIAYLLGGLARERIVLRHQREALVDPLTGVANRRAFFEQGERLLRRLQYAHRPAAVVVLDLDRFKQVNDRFGHPAGDRLLCGFCDIATAALRPGDLFARIGGEEFACLLVNAPRNGALLVAERIRARFEAAPPVAEGVESTVSSGVAIAETGDDLAALIGRADAALYSAKAKGRNRVEIAPPALALVERAAG